MTFEKAMLLLGVVVGMIMLLFGVFLYYVGVPPWRLSFCIGFGIILGSFGVVASVNTKLWTITGAAATAIILYWISSPSTQQYTVGLISGDFPEGTVAWVRDVQDVPGGFMENKRTYRMVLLGDHLESDRLVVEIKQPNGAPFMREISRDYVDKLITQRHNNFTWSWRNNDLVDPEGKPVPTVTVLAGPGRAISPIGLVGAARANGRTPQPSPADLQRLAENLTSSDYQTRRDARNALIEADVPAIRIVIDTLARQADPASDKAFEFYYVLVNIQRKNVRNSSSIQAVLKDEDFSLLIKGVGSHEREVRTLATEFLYGISDKRALRPSLDLLRSTNDQDAQWNSVLIIKSFYSNLAAGAKAAAAAELRAANVGSRTRSAIESLVGP